MRSAAVYSARYISSRFLPDKAIDLVDEAASSLRLAQESKPPALEALDRDIVTLQIEIESLKHETDPASIERLTIVEMELQGKKMEQAELERIWLAGTYLSFLHHAGANTSLERDRLNHTKDLKKRLEEAKYQLEVAQRLGEFEKASQLRFGTIPDIQKQLLPLETETNTKELTKEGKLAGMLHDRVTSDDIAQVVAKATGIPVANLLKGERDKLVHASSRLFLHISIKG